MNTNTIEYLPSPEELEREATDATLVSKLAALPRMEYDRVRKTEAEKLKIRPATLDAEIKELKKPRSDGMQGGAVVFPEVEPWGEAVEGAAILQVVSARIREFVATSPEAADAIALWAAHAHCFTAFSHTPRLNIFAPEKGCGKTTLRDVVGCFVPKPISAENFSAAVLFRLTAEHKPTILADEYDTWLRDNEELRGLLNAGHGRGGCAYRCEGDNHEVRRFEVFCPAILAGIGNLPGTLADRSIQIRLERAKPGELSRRFDSRRTSSEQDLARMLSRFTTDEFSKIEECEPDMPPGAVNRTADNWRPLFAIATVAGGDWLERARAAFIKLTAGAGQENQGLGTTLLADIQAVFATIANDRVFSADLISALVGMEGHPWVEFGSSGKPITASKLATQLRRFKIAPRDARIGNDKGKCYFRCDFEDSFARYVVSEVSGRDTETTLENIDHNALLEARQAKSVSRSENSVSINKDGLCLGVSDRKPEDSVCALPPLPTTAAGLVSSTQEVMCI